MRHVVDANHISAYKLRVRFDDGAIKIVDLADHLTGPIFQPLRDLEFFRRVTVNHDIETVTWPNDADFSPDFLYEIGRPVSDEPQ